MRVALWIGVPALVAAGGIVAYRKLYYLPRFHEVVPGRVYRSRQPRYGNFLILQQHGIRRIICLYPEAELPGDFRKEKRWCAENGVEFIHIPIPDRIPTEDQVSQFLRAVRTSAGPVLFHCVAWRRRAGLMEAVCRVCVDGWSVDRAVAQMAERNHVPVGADREQHLAVLRWVQADRQRLLSSTTGPSATRPS